MWRQVNYTSREFKLEEHGAEEESANEEHDQAELQREQALFIEYQD